MVTFWLPVNVLVSFSRIPLWCTDGFVWLQSRCPPLSPKPLKVKETINRNMNDMMVKQRSLQSDWFSSIQLTLMGGTAAVKANQLPWKPASFTVTYVLNRNVPIYLSYTDIPKSCRIYISCLSFNIYYQIHITFLSDAEHLSCLGRQTLSSALTFSQDHLKLEAFFSVFVASCLSIYFPPTVCMTLFIQAESERAPERLPEDKWVGSEDEWMGWAAERDASRG